MSTSDVVSLLGMTRQGIDYHYKKGGVESSIRNAKRTILLED